MTHGEVYALLDGIEKTTVIKLVENNFITFLDPGLQQSYTSATITSHEVACGALFRRRRDCHLSDGVAWLTFNVAHPDFAREIINVTLGLCTDGFNQFGNLGQQFSCCPVILTLYNLPP